MELLGIAMEATKTNHEMQNFVRSPRATKSAPFERQSIACYGLQCLTDSVEARELVPALASKLSKCTEPRVWSDGGGPEVWTIGPEVSSTKEKHLADRQFQMLRENDGIYMVRVIYKDSRDRAEAMNPHSWLTVIFAVPRALES